MGYVSRARWAFCRSAHLSSWSRTVNANMQAHRGLASCLAMKLAAEPLPLAGFPEQRSSIVGSTARVCIGEEVEEASGGSTAQIVASILRDMAEWDVAVRSCYIEITDLQGLGCFTHVHTNAGPSTS